MHCRSVLLGASIAICVSTGCRVSHAGRTSTPDVVAKEEKKTPWFRKWQQASVTPLPEATNESFGITIPGLWGNDSNDRISEIHENEGIAFVSLQGIAATSALLEKKPELKAAVTKDLSGSPTPVSWYSWEEAPVYVMSILNPTFQHFLIDKAKKAIDVGADAIVIDEIQTSAVLLSMAPKGAGFAETEVKAYEDFLTQNGYKNFRDYLSREFPNQAKLLSQYLPSQLSFLTFLKLKDPQLAEMQNQVFVAYKNFYENYAHRIVTKIVAMIRQHGAAKGKTIPIGANLAGMGRLSHKAPMASLPWQGVLDFVVFENEVREYGTPGNFVLFPQGSAAPYYQLAKALVPGSVFTFPSFDLAKTIIKQKHAGTYLSQLYAEAMAHGVHWVVGHWYEELGIDDEAFTPTQVQEMAKFASRWKDLLTVEKKPSPVAIVYSNAAMLKAPEAHDSFLGIGQALSLMNIPYDVVYMGDQRFNGHMPDVTTLNKYQTILVPAADALPTAQRTLLSQASTHSITKVIAFGTDPQAFSNGNVQQDRSDPGLAYRQGQAPDAYGILYKHVAQYAFFEKPKKNPISAIPAMASDNSFFAVHLINRHLDGATQTLTNQEKVDVAIQIPQGFQSGWRLTLITPDQTKPQQLSYVEREQDLLVTIPSLKNYGILLFSGSDKSQLALRH